MAETKSQSINHSTALMILTWKNLPFTEELHSNSRLAASNVFHMFTQSIKFF